MVDPEQQYVVCRAGVIARIRDLLEDKTTDFLVDAAVFPGNSGGPVILKPELASLSGTKAIGQAVLIGRGRSYPRPCRRTAWLQVGPPFKPCMRISRTRLPSGRSNRRITRTPDTEPATTPSRGGQPSRHGPSGREGDGPGTALAATHSRQCNWRALTVGYRPPGELVPVLPDMPSRVLALPI